MRRGNTTAGTAVWKFLIAWCGVVKLRTAAGSLHDPEACGAEDDDPRSGASPDTYLRAQAQPADSCAARHKESKKEQQARGQSRCHRRARVTLGCEIYDLGGKRYIRRANKSETGRSSTDGAHFGRRVEVQIVHPFAVGRIRFSVRGPHVKQLQGSNRATSPPTQNRKLSCSNGHNGNRRDICFCLTHRRRRRNPGPRQFRSGHQHRS